MFVVVLTDDHPPMVGGIAVFVERLCRELVARGHEVGVVARRRPGIRPIPGTALRTVWAPRAWRARAFAWRAGGWLARADRILATTWPVAAGLEGVAYDVVAHGSDVTRPPADAATFARVWAGARRRYATSAFLAGHVGAEVLPAPVPIAHAPREGGQGWVLVARATPLKGGDRFVAWVARAGVEGHVVGDGPELARWRALAAELGARVTFHGALPPDAALAVVRSAALAVLAPRAASDGSGAEGFGLALVEAMGQGVPVVGCRTGGVPEAVGPGLLVADPDDPARCVAEIEAFLATRPGERAWRWVRDHHGADRTAEAWLRSR